MSRPYVRGVVVVVGLIGALTGARVARADSASAQAEALFRQGKELMAKGKVAEACTAFDASQRLEPRLATVLNQAACREKNGQLATAWGLFLEAEHQSRAATDDNTVKLHQVAADHAAKLEPRLSTLQLNVPADARVAGLEILRNNELVDPGAWNKPLPVDGGSHQITARAPGNAEWSSAVTVGLERDARAIDIPRLKAAAISARPTAGGAAAATHRDRTVPIALGVAALALGGGALGLELSARSTYDKAEREPNNVTQDSLWHSANNRRYVAEGLGVAGLACAGVAVWLLVRGGEPEAAPATAAHARLLVEPVLAADRAGLAISGRF